MAIHNDIGVLGEEIAINFLEEAGYLILEVNWRWRRAELDIIAKYKERLIFVEVKTRANSSFGFPEEAVNAKKESLMVGAAAEYMYQHDYEEEYQFDIITVTLEPFPRVNHIEDAFFPGWH